MIMLNSAPQAILVMGCPLYMICRRRKGIESQEKGKNINFLREETSLGAHPYPSFFSLATSFHLQEDPDLKSQVFTSKGEPDNRQGRGLGWW